MNTSPRLVEDMTESFSRPWYSFCIMPARVGALMRGCSGMKVCAQTLTLKGFLDDVSASLVLSLPDTNGVTNCHAGVIGRDGQFWVEEVPLVAGTNDLALTATDVWGNMMTTNVTVVKTSFPLTLDPVPVLGMECCAVEDRAPWLAAGEMGIYHYSRNAQTRLVLFTGGRHGVRRRNLFVCTANATEVRHKGATPPYNAPWLQGWTRWIAPQTIQLGELGPVGSNGFLYKVLPDNETLDFTPRVKNKEFYHFGVTQQKHKLFLTANGQVLSPDGQLTAKLLVGERVDLSSFFDPVFSQQPVTTSKWTLGGKFINAFTVWGCPIPGEPQPKLPESAYDLNWGLTDFRVCSELLHLKDTRAWWGRRKPCGVSANDHQVGFESRVQ
jgi:hypothetical protein